MLYGIIAVFDQMSVFKRCHIGRRLRTASRANSGQAVEYALTSRTLLLQPHDLASRHFAERLVYGWRRSLA